MTTRFAGTMLIHLAGLYLLGLQGKSLADEVRSITSIDDAHPLLLKSTHLLGAYGVSDKHGRPSFVFKFPQEFQTYEATCINELVTQKKQLHIVYYKSLQEKGKDSIEVVPLYLEKNGEEFLVTTKVVGEPIQARRVVDLLKSKNIKNEHSTQFCIYEITNGDHAGKFLAFSKNVELAKKELDEQLAPKILSIGSREEAAVFVKSIPDEKSGK